jgi:hypothetical protein
MCEQLSVFTRSGTRQSVSSQGYSNFYVVWAASAKFDLHMGSMKFNTQNEELKSILILHV